MNKLNNLTFLDVIINLRAMYDIQVNDKLIIHDDKFEIDNSYFPFLSRWYNMNSRLQTLTFIKKIIETAIYYSNGFIEYNDGMNINPTILKNNLLLLTDCLENAMKGLANIKITYSMDIDFVNVMDCILNAMRVMIFNNRNNTKTMIKI